MPQSLAHDQLMLDLRLPSQLHSIAILWLTSANLYCLMTAGMLSPRNGLGLEAKSYGLGLVASGLGLGLIDAVASASTVWPRSLIVL